MKTKIINKILYSLNTTKRNIEFKELRVTNDKKNKRRTIYTDTTITYAPNTLYIQDLKYHISYYFFDNKIYFIMRDCLNANHGFIETLSHIYYDIPNKFIVKTIKMLLNKNNLYYIFESNDYYCINECYLEI
jgi:hypothetical protein